MVVYLPEVRLGQSGNDQNQEKERERAGYQNAIRDQRHCADRARELQGRDKTETRAQVLSQ